MAKISSELESQIRETKTKNPGISNRELSRKFKKHHSVIERVLDTDPGAMTTKQIEDKSQYVYYKDKAQNLESVVKSLLKERGKHKAFIDDLKAVTAATEPLPLVQLKPSGSAGTPIAAVVKLSDWQIGEVINAAETEGFGEFNFAIAEQRVNTLAVKVLDWVTMHRKAGYNVPELHIFSEADLVSGDIHMELSVTNEFPAPIATEKAGTLLASFIGQLAPHFKKVKVWEVSADNHGRLTRKNQWKQGAKNNWSYLVHSVANFRLAKHTNVEPIMGEGVKLLANVMGKGYLLCHGHHLISQLGVPFYAMTRDKAREAVKRMWTEEKFDYISMGHFHVPGIIDGNILVNGNLPGTTELDTAVGRQSPPCQVSFMSHPRWGMFDWTAWKL